MVYGVYSICPYVLWDSKQNLNYTGVLVHFDDRYCLLGHVPNGKKYVSPIWKGKILNSRKQKIDLHFVTS